MHALRVRMHAGKEEVPCPSLMTIILPDALGYQADEDYRSSISCPDVAEVCGSTKQFPGQVSCAAHADCRERGVCSGGHCKCVILHA